MKENMEKIAEMTRLSISEVFEKMFFLFLEPPDDECNEYDMEAAIRFEGSISGEIRVLLSRDIAKTMIQNMLGLKEDEITTQRMEDCSKEAVNMICGNFLGKLDSTKVFNLSIPSFAGGGFIRPAPLGSMNQTPTSAGMESTGIEPGENARRMDFGSESGTVGVVVTLSD